MPIDKFDLSEVAKKLRIAESHLKRDIERGRLQGTKLGSTWVFTLRNLERYLGAQRAFELFVGDAKEIQAVVVSAPLGERVKRCIECDRLRPLDDFERDGTATDWRSPVCRSCKRMAAGRTWPSRED